MNLEFDHIQITVERHCESASLQFYRTVMEFLEIQKPDSLQKNGGAWFQVGTMELHVSHEDSTLNNKISKRHICYKTSDIDQVRTRLEKHGVEIIPDLQPIAEWIRFYIRDPGGNRIEIAQRVSSVD